MPKEKCTANGKSGTKYGSGGKCYTGKGAESKAAKQGIAIEASKARKKK